MIHDLDTTLKALLEKEIPKGDLQDHAVTVTISFERPDPDFPPSGVALPAIDLFLYDVRENHDLRSNEGTT